MTLGKATNPVRYIRGVITTREPEPTPVHSMCARMAGFAHAVDVEPVATPAPSVEPVTVPVEPNPWRNQGAGVPWPEAAYERVIEYIPEDRSWTRKGVIPRIGLGPLINLLWRFVDAGEQQ